jgi:hypothetical protein
LYEGNDKLILILVIQTLRAFSFHTAYLQRRQDKCSVTGGKYFKSSCSTLALYGAETWTRWTVNQKYLGSFEMLWRRMEKISWTDRGRNEEVLHRVKEERNILKQ